MEVVAYSPEWLPQLGALARAHARLVAPASLPDDQTVERGLDHHHAWPFYSPGMDTSQVRLVIEGDQLLAAGQLGLCDHGWGYGAALGDGPDWLHETHAVLFWLFAWPGWPEAIQAAALLAATTVRQARAEGLPGLEAFRGGAGFLPLGTQCSSRWPHLFAPLRAVGFRQPRPLVVYGGALDPSSLPTLDPDVMEHVECHARRGRVEAWLDGVPRGVCDAEMLPPVPTEDRFPSRSTFRPNLDINTPAARRSRRRGGNVLQWAHIRRLWVDNETRSLGIGRVLLQTQLQRLADHGATHWALHLPEDPGNGPAHGLYSQFGQVLDRQFVLRVSF